MLAYASSRELPGKRESSPNALLLVISVHVALLALAMSAKMDIQRTIRRNPQLINIPVPVAPPSDSRPRALRPQPRPVIDRQAADPLVPRADPQPSEPTPIIADAVPAAGDGTAVLPIIPAPKPVAPIHHDPRLLTPLSELKPPYPAAKLASEEEATLRLRLSIDKHGRVTAVDPIGAADREFLESARRYILGHWRYEPASDGGEPASSTLTVTLQFELDS